MKLKTLNEHFYLILLKHKDICLNHPQVNYIKPFPLELIDVCVIIHWRYKKFNAALKKFNIKENEVLFLEDNSIISIYGDIILPPIIISKNIAAIKMTLHTFLFCELHNEEHYIRYYLSDYLYLICLNPILINKHKSLISLIVKISKQARKQHPSFIKLKCLKVIHKQTGQSIFPFEYIEFQNVDKLKFPVNVYKGDVSKLKLK